MTDELNILLIKILKIMKKLSEPFREAVKIFEDSLQNYINRWRGDKVLRKVIIRILFLWVVILFIEQLLKGIAYWIGLENYFWVRSVYWEVIFSSILVIGYYLFSYKYERLLPQIYFPKREEEKEEFMKKGRIRGLFLYISYDVSRFVLKGTEKKESPFLFRSYDVYDIFLSLKEKKCIILYGKSRFDDNFLEIPIDVFLYIKDVGYFTNQKGRMEDMQKICWIDSAGKEHDLVYANKAFDLIPIRDFLTDSLNFLKYYSANEEILEETDIKQILLDFSPD